MGRSTARTSGVFLHGFALLAPDIDAGHIDHLTRQGYLVVFPQFQKGGAGLLGDMNQNDVLARAPSPRSSTSRRSSPTTTSRCKTAGGSRTG